MGCEGLGSGAKCCIVCGVVTVVVLAVMIPVGIFVIGPNVAQHVLDQSTVALPNLTQAACPANYTWLFNSAKINVPKIGPIAISSTIVSFKQEVWTTSCDKDGVTSPGALCGDNAIETQMGTYTSPEMTVSPGDNYNNFTVVMNSNSSLILNAWVVPLWLTQEKTRLILKATDVSVKVMGLTFKGLTMRNELTCTGVVGSPSITIPDSVCYPNDPKQDPYQTQEYTAICVAGALDIATTTTSKQATTTTKPTTTTAPPAAAVIA